MCDPKRLRRRLFGSALIGAWAWMSFVVAPAYANDCSWQDRVARLFDRKHAQHQVLDDNYFAVGFDAPDVALLSGPHRQYLQMLEEAVKSGDLDSIRRLDEAAAAALKLQGWTGQRDIRPILYDFLYSHHKRIPPKEMSDALALIDASVSAGLAPDEILSRLFQRVSLHQGLKDADLRYLTAARVRAHLREFNIVVSGNPNSPYAKLSEGLRKLGVDDLAYDAGANVRGQKGMYAPDRLSDSVFISTRSFLTGKADGIFTHEALHAFHTRLVRQGASDPFAQLTVARENFVHRSLHPTRNHDGYRSIFSLEELDTFKLSAVHESLQVRRNLTKLAETRLQELLLQVPEAQREAFRRGFRDAWAAYLDSRARPALAARADPSQAYRLGAEAVEHLKNSSASALGAMEVQDADRYLNYVSADYVNSEQAAAILGDTNQEMMRLLKSGDNELLQGAVFESLPDPGPSDIRVMLESHAQGRGIDVGSIPYKHQIRISVPTRFHRFKKVWTIPRAADHTILLTNAEAEALISIHRRFAAHPELHGDPRTVAQFRAETADASRSLLKRLRNRDAPLRSFAEDTVGEYDLLGGTSRLSRSAANLTIDELKRFTDLSMKLRRDAKAIRAPAPK